MGVEIGHLFFPVVFSPPPRSGCNIQDYLAGAVSLTENSDAFAICFCITKRKRLTLLQIMEQPTAHLTGKEMRKSQTTPLHRSEKPLLMRNHILAQKAWTVSETSVNPHPTTNHQEA